MATKLIAPSVLAADFANLQRDIEMVNNSEADWFHIDIMDGVFVPNISYGMPVLQAITKHAKKTIDVHLMIVDPDRYIKEFAALGANNLTVHYEACTHLHRTLQAIKAEGMKAGIAINPHTSVEFLKDVIADTDIVIIMSVNPGFGGQSFIENTYKKIRRLKEIIVTSNAPTLIEIDGGVTNENAAQLVEAGADVLVAGSYVFKAKDQIETIKELKKLQIHNQVYNIIIIGGGPIGIACALEAKKNNLSYIILEKGCLVNSLYHYPTNMTFFSTSEKLELDNIPFISTNPKPRKAEALEYYRRIVTSNELNIRLFEKVTSVEPIDHNYKITTSKGSYTAQHVIVATGFYDIPNYLNVPGEDLPKVKHYYNDPHFYATQKTIVVGASNSAVDAALEIYRKGGDVSMIVRKTEIGQRVKYWVRPDIINRIEEGSIKAYFNSHIKEIKEDHVILATPEGDQTIENDFVLLLTGYRPNFTFLENMGIALSKDEKRIPQYDKKTMETNVPGIYLAGVVCGGMETHKWFIENSRVHSQMIINDITEKLKEATRME